MPKDACSNVINMEIIAKKTHNNIEGGKKFETEQNG